MAEESNVTAHVNINSSDGLSVAERIRLECLKLASNRVNELGYKEAEVLPIAKKYESYIKHG